MSTDQGTRKINSHEVYCHDICYRYPKKVCPTHVSHQIVQYLHEERAGFDGSGARKNLYKTVLLYRIYLLNPESISACIDPSQMQEVLGLSPIA